MSTPEQDQARARAESMMTTLNDTHVEAERDFINDVLDAITTPAKKIPEPVFRELFLPYFLGERSPVPGADDYAVANDPVVRSPVAHWIGLVGSATEPADVVDVTGKVLFQVPPMMDSTRVDTVNRNPDAHNFQTVFSEYQDQSRVHEALGKNYLIEQLTKKAIANLPAGAEEKSPYSWEPVLQYYHLTDTKEEVKAAKNTISDDDLSFD